MLDFKKRDKHLYPTKTDPSIRMIPAFRFLAYDGTGILTIKRVSIPRR